MFRSFHVRPVIEYILDAVLHNGEVREQLDQTKSRHQDVVMILQDQMRKHVGLASASTAPENLVKRMFSKNRLPTRGMIKGYITFASFASPDILKQMVDFSFEVPAWFFRDLAVEFLKLSGRPLARLRRGSLLACSSH